ncbi:hypothetical protein [Ichthyobacterium seriolicida]|uniref:Uncharacterized protein n=1 Tax=Ichthyobacterium seriolicida TaxID=242600 RepID=A0A1J1E3Z0_9FLAO|nr:hypothetical protein [Ichthyobacterium seriolicida]BAV94764.1 hypothetical protein JBKA6_0751 [Ichthyobacterium seriolicida]
MSSKAIQVAIISLFVSCFSDGSYDSLKEQYLLTSENVKLKWAAYKTTDKIPLYGSFKEIYISESKKSDVLEESIRNMKFKIPIKSLNSGYEVRDLRIVRFFFNSMANTSNIEGRVKEVTENNILFLVTLNDIEGDISATYTMTEDSVLVISAEVDLLRWNLSSSIESLNTECLDLHKGTDGISKLWDKVDIIIEVDLKKNLD